MSEWIRREDAEKRLQNEIAVYKEILTDYVALKQYWAEQQANPALTWDELKTMEGKPVWVVPEEEKGYWFVIEFFNNNPYYGGDRVIFTNDVILNRCDLGTKWQAYRKERA